MPSAGQPGSVRDDVEAIISRAQRRLAEQPVGSLARQLRGALHALKRVDDYDDLTTQLRRLVVDLDSYRAVLATVLDEVREAEKARADAERFGEVWWKRRQRQVAEAFQAGPDEGRRRWLATYAEALLAERFDVCHRIALAGWPSPDGSELFKAGAAALKERRYRDAVDVLELLAGDGAGTGPLDAATRATVIVFLGRIYLYELSNLAAAQEQLRCALELLPNDGRAVAAFGECLRAGGDRERAAESFTRAVQLSPHLPDGYIGAALLNEDRQWWHRARDWYDDAIDAAGEGAAFGQLLAPHPGGLYWQLARRLSKHDPEAALAAVDRALEQGVRWSQDYPDRKALADRAAILERLGRPAEAAASYFAAGRRYSWIGDDRKARPLLERAYELDPSNPVAAWQLAESLRVLSYKQEAPFVDLDLVQESKERWEAGSAVGRPDGETAWAYLGRALLNEQRWTMQQDPDLMWEAATYLECALLLNPAYATAWAYLGQCHRFLGNVATALHTTERALALDPADLAGLEQRAAILVGAGRYAEAEEIIDQRLAYAREWWAVALKADVLLRTDRLDDAIAVIDRAVEAVPDKAQYRSIRALCYQLLGQFDRSREDYQWLWDRRDTEQGAHWPPQVTGWAGYVLGQLDEAVDIYQEALKTGAFEPATLWCEIGQVRLARGDPSHDDVVEGERALEEGISLIRSTGQFRDLLDLNLRELERVLTAQDGTEPALAALARVRSRATEAYEALSGAEMSPEDELRPAAAAAARSSSQWLGAQAGLARSEGAAGRWTEALDAYVALSASSSFPEADAGVAEAIGKLQEQADVLIADGRVTEARDRLLELLAVAEEHPPRWAGVTAGLHARVAFASLALSDDDTAARHLGRAMEGGPADGGSPDELAELEQGFLRNPDDYWAHVDGLRRLQRRYEQGSAEQARLEALAGRLSVSGMYRLEAADADRAVTFPIATPLTLRIDSSLLPAGGIPSLRRDLTNLQRRIEHETGIRIPGVRIIRDAQLGPGDYTILIDDVPVAWGSLLPDGVFVLHQHTSSPPQAGRPGLDPLSGRPGMWLAEPDEQLRDVPQCGPAGFVVRHLEATVRRGLACFIGPDDVQAWLDRSQDVDQVLARTAVPDRTARVVLSRVLEALASERVPLTDRNPVLKAMRDMPPGAGVVQITAAVRRKLRTRLPGNASGTRRVTVPRPLQERLTSGLHRANGSRFWELPRDECAALCRELQDLSADAGTDEPVTLVVSSSELRPFVWRLLAPGLPSTSVSSEEELL